MNEHSYLPVDAEMAQYIKTHAADDVLRRLSEDDLVRLAYFVDDFFEDHEDVLNPDAEDMLDIYEDLVTAENPDLFDFLREQAKSIDGLELTKARFIEFMDLQDEFLEELDDDVFEIGDDE